MYSHYPQAVAEVKTKAKYKLVTNLQSKSFMIFSALICSGYMNSPVMASIKHVTYNKDKTNYNVTWPRTARLNEAMEFKVTTSVGRVPKNGSSWEVGI